MQISSISLLNSINKASNVAFKNKSAGDKKSEESASISNQAPLAVDSYGKALVQKRINITNEEGEIRFWTIVNKDGFSLFNKDGILLFEKTKTPYSRTIETTYSPEGKRLSSTETLLDGTTNRRIYDENGNLQRLIHFNLLQDPEILEDYTVVEISDRVKEKLPKYLYHITPKDNIDSIKEDGFEPSLDMDIFFNGHSAVFLISEHDLLNTWCNLTNGVKKFRDDSLLARLLKFCDKSESGELAIIKLATSKLDLNSLRIRDENDVMFTNGEQKFVPDEYKDDYFLLKETLRDASGGACSEPHAETICENIYMFEHKKRLGEGVCLDEIDKYNDKPLEYFHTKPISPDAIVDVATLNAQAILDISEKEKECEIVAKKLVQDCLSKMS